MVQVNVKTKDEIQEESPVQMKEYSDERGEKKAEEKKEIPLEKMTKADLLKKIEEVQGQAEKNFDLYARSQAEIENLKKRFQKDKEDLVKFSNESLIRQLLLGMDSLEKAILHSQNGDPIHTLREGVELTLKGMMDTMKKTGLEEVKAIGEAFDPNFHEAIAEQEDNNVKPGTVLQEIQKGYILNQRLLRPAMVIVSKNTG